MEITVKLNFTAFQRFTNHLFNGKNFRKLLRTRIRVLPVEIHGRQTAPVVADYYSVWVDHRHNFKHKPVTQGLGHLVVTHQKLNQSLHDEGAVAFTRVHPAGQDYAFPASDCFLGARKVCNYEHLDRVAGRSLAKTRPPNEGARIRHGDDPI